MRINCILKVQMKNSNFVQKKSKGALRNTFIRGSLLYYVQNSKNMEHELYFEGKNENANKVKNIVNNQNVPEMIISKIEKGWV